MNNEILPEANPYKTERFAVHGSVRGFLGVWHKTEEAAHKAVRRDNAACRLHGGYSDTSVYRVQPGSDEGVMCVLMGDA